MRVVIADDHPIFRQGLINVIQEDGSFEIVGGASDGDKALRLIENLAPDIAILDISMPGMTGLELAKKARTRDLSASIVVMTMYDDESYLDEAMEAGVMGYLLKDNAATDLINCLKTIAAGRRYVSPSMSEYLIGRHSEKKHLEDDKPGLKDLTKTEKRILKLIAQSMTSKEIAKELFISYRTVQNHRANICDKLNLRGSNALLQFAIEHKSVLMTI
jgi:DNA-binding NarL/FixJ family response regulator